MTNQSAILGIRSGYVDTTIGTCFGGLSHDVVNVDVDESVVETISAGDAPIHEERLAELIANTPAPTEPDACARPRTARPSSTLR